MIDVEVLLKNKPIGVNRTYCIPPLVLMQHVENNLYNFYLPLFPNYKNSLPEIQKFIEENQSPSQDYTKEQLRELNTKLCRRFLPSFQLSQVQQPVRVPIVPQLQGQFTLSFPPHILQQFFQSLQLPAFQGSINNTPNPSPNPNPTVRKVLTSGSVQEHRVQMSVKQLVETGIHKYCEINRLNPDNFKKDYPEIVQSLGHTLSQSLQGRTQAIFKLTAKNEVVKGIIRWIDEGVAQIKTRKRAESAKRDTPEESQQSGKRVKLSEDTLPPLQKQLFSGTTALPPIQTILNQAPDPSPRNWREEMRIKQAQEREQLWAQGKK